MACRRESGFKDTIFWWIVGLSFFLFLEKKEANFAQAERRAELARAMLRQGKISEAKIQGRHHRSRRTKRTWLVSPSNHPAMPAVPHAPNPVWFWLSRSRHTGGKQHSNGQRLTLYRHRGLIAGLTRDLRDLLNRQRTTPLVVASIGCSVR